VKDNRTVKIEGRSLPRGVKQLAVPTICNVRIPIIRATVEQVPELAEGDRLLDAYFCMERLVIFVREGQSKTHERDSITHELAHAFIYLSGLGHRLKGFFDKPEAYDRFEEEIVRAMTPHLCGINLGGAPWL
jgi:hypothetical protein